MASTHLSRGYDVIIPYLLVYPSQAIELSKIADVNNARFIELYIELNKKEAIERLMARGNWGEIDAPLLDEEELKKASVLYDKMESAMKTRPEALKISFKLDDIEKTYSGFIAALG